MISLLNGPVYLPPHVREAFNQPICDLRHPRFKDAYAYCRLQTAELLGAAGYETLLAAGSGTFGVETVLRSCLRPTDQVLVLLMGTFSSRLAEIAEWAGAQVRREWAPLGDAVALDRIETLLHERQTDFVLVAHAEPSTGTQVNLSAVAALCKRYQSTLIVDGVCGGFALEVNCRRDHLGAYITASQKGLALPPGMAVAVISPDLMHRAHTISEQRTGIYGHLKNWTASTPSFTPPILHIFALEKSLQYITMETIAKRAERHRQYSRRVQTWGASQRLKPVPVRPEVTAWALSAFYYPMGFDDQWLRTLRDEEGLELAPSNDARLAGTYFRIGHLGDLPEDQLEQGLAILERQLRIPQEHSREAVHVER